MPAEARRREGQAGCPSAVQDPSVEREGVGIAEAEVRDVVDDESRDAWERADPGANFRPVSPDTEVKGPLRQGGEQRPEGVA